MRESINTITIENISHLSLIHISPTDERRKIFRRIFKTEPFDRLQERLRDEAAKLTARCQDLQNAIRRETERITCGRDEILEAELKEAKEGRLPFGEEAVLVGKILRCV